MLAFSLMASRDRNCDYAVARWALGNGLSGHGTGEGMGVGRAKALVVGVECGVPCGAQGAAQTATNPRPMSVRVHVYASR